MTTTELIKLLQSIERGSSGRSREVSFSLDYSDGPLYIHEPDISINSTGDGIAGAQVCFDLTTNKL